MNGNKGDDVNREMGKRDGKDGKEVVRRRRQAGIRRGEGEESYDGDVEWGMRGEGERVVL